MQTIECAERAFVSRDWRSVVELLRDDGDDSDRRAELLAAAAWWLDDLPLAIATRERLFAARRERGDSRGAASVAIQLSWDNTIGRRDTAIAGGWASRARALLEGTEPGADHVWLMLREATLAGAGPEAFADARRRAASIGAFDAEITATTLEGNALVAAGQVADGLAMMDGAAAAACAGELEDPLAITFACCQVLGACSRVRDFDRAGQWCDRIAAMCADQNIWTVLSVSRCMYAPVLVSRGRYTEAERILTIAMSHYAELIPHHRSEAAVWLADLRVREGRKEEALLLLDQAEPDEGCRLVRATLALDDGACGEAVDHAAAFLRQSSRDRFTERLAAYDIVVRAESARGDVDAAACALEEARRIAELLGSQPAHAAVLRGEAAIALASGDVDQARVTLGDAADIFERGQAPYEAARARIELAGVLESLGRRDDAVRERARAEQALQELRAPRVAGGPLTARECEVLQLVAQGLSNHEIAQRLVLSTHTVHRHVANVLRKLGVGSRAAAVSRASQLGLL